MNANALSNSRLVRFWSRSAGMWSAVTGLIVFLDIVWNLPQSLANSRPSQLLVELAVEIFLALSFAGLAGALVWARRNGPG